MAKLRKSGSRSRADLVVAYLTQLRLDLALARLQLQVSFKPKPWKHYLALCQVDEEDDPFLFFFNHLSTTGLSL